MKGKNIFWGIFLIVAAIYVICTGLGIGIGLIRLFLGIYFISTLVKGITEKNWYGIVFSVAFLFILFGKYIKITISIWIVLLAALLLSQGLTVLLGGKNKNR